jgi:hypothetical protein
MGQCHMHVQNECTVVFLDLRELEREENSPSEAHGSAL